MAREIAGFSVSDVARRLGKSKSTIHAWEADDGASPRSLEDLVALCRLYGITADWYLEGTEPIFRADDASYNNICPHVRAIIEAMPEMSEKQRGVVAQLVGVMTEKQ